MVTVRTLIVFLVSFFINRVVRKVEEAGSAPKGKGRGRGGKKRESEQKNAKTEAETAAPTKRARGKRAQ